MSENLALITQKTEEKKVIKETFNPLSSKKSQTPQVTQFLEDPTPPPPLHFNKEGAGPSMTFIRYFHHQKKTSLPQDRDKNVTTRLMSHFCVYFLNMSF